MISPIEAAEQACIACNIEDNEYSDHTTDDLVFALEELIKFYDRRINLIEAQIAESSGQIDAQQMAEFKESFQHFDTNGDGSLSRLEFKSVMSSLGLVDVTFDSQQDDKFERIFTTVSEGNECISFDQYVTYMSSLASDDISPALVEDSFGSVADGKQWITEEDMRRACIPEEDIEFLKSDMPKNEQGGYDYKSWISK
jgi:Ca2+-binding EF-hand superfamily protein